MTASPIRQYQSINLAQKMAAVQALWSQRVVAEINDYQFKLARVDGDFIWHAHGDTDEAFLVLAGELRIDFRDGHVLVGPGELFVVPRGVEHKPSAGAEVQMLVIEPRGVRNTGAAAGARTTPNDLWI